MEEPVIGDGPQHLYLYVRAGRDGSSFGACPICQTIFQALLFKARGGALSFTLVSINAAKPPDELRYIARSLPAVLHAGEIYKDEQVILDYINHAFPKPFLPIGGKKANTAVLNFFSKFTFYIRDVSDKPTFLLNELGKIDRFLAGDGGPGTDDDPAPSRFLNGSDWSALDMAVLSKLQHVRIACKAFKTFEIPSNFKNLWRYLYNAYSDEIFKRSCPSDEEIIFVWGQKVANLSCCPMEIRHIVQNSLDTDASKTYTFDVPVEVLKELNV